jgi:hypothetical protein
VLAPKVAHEGLLTIEKASFIPAGFVVLGMKE